LRFPDTRVRSAAVERFLKSFAFSGLLFLAWGAFTAIGVASLLQSFGFTELLWAAYNSLISLLFLVRKRPAFVSMDAVHWLVALVTSFSGFLMSRLPGSPSSASAVAGDVLVTAGILLGIASAAVLGRSYDVLPALRGVSTAFVYGVVRHPMYLSSIAIKVGYVLLHPSWYNAGLLAIVTFLYVKRAMYEEGVLKRDPRYADYMNRVQYRFIPWLL
jgi:protein-S-isoprenylcysteine O-methyltransferase Ste14